MKSDRSEKSKTCRTWLCTLNNPIHSLEQVHHLTKAKYTIGQLEQGDNGTKHFQFYQVFSDNIRLSHYKKTFHQIHAEPVIFNNGADKYCMKEESRLEGPWEFGEKPIRRNNKTDWELVYLNAKLGKIESIPSDIRVRCYSNLKKIQKDHIVLKDSNSLRGVWIYGPSGVGKSRLARVQFPSSYPKLCNKWWDGYQDQDYVIMDDIGLEHKCLGQQLKIWADRYGCILETKGGAVASNFSKFIVTSQYSIDEIFSDDYHTIEALKRRFKIINLNFKLDFESDNWLNLFE